MVKYLYVNLQGCCFVVFKLVAAVSAGVFVEPGAGWECVSFGIAIEYLGRDFCWLYGESTYMDGGHCLRQLCLNNTTSSRKLASYPPTTLWAYCRPTAERYKQYRSRRHGLGSADTSPFYPVPSSTRPKCRRIRRNLFLRISDSSPRRRCNFRSRRRRRRRVGGRRLP